MNCRMGVTIPVVRSRASSDRDDVWCRSWFSFRAGMVDPAPQPNDVTRRTWLAAERTWLAWWRSGVAVGAVALAVGRFLPEITHRETTWPFKALGLAYGLLSVGVLAAGGLRQRRGAEALRQGSFEPLS